MGNRNRLLQGVGVCTSFCGVIDLNVKVVVVSYHACGAGMG